MKTFWIYLSIFAVFLSGCGHPGAKTDEEVVTEVEKQPYYVATRSISDLTSSTMIEKNGKIAGAQAITVTSQVNWRIKSITKRAGETIDSWQQIMALTDHTGSYSFAVQRARASLNSAQSSYNSSKVNLDKAITDSWIAIQQAETQQAAADQSWQWSTAIQIQQLNEQVRKAEFDYETTLLANKQTIDNFVSNAKNLVRDVQLLYENVRTESDKILWISPLYQNYNDNFQARLAVRNSWTKILAEDTLRRLINDEGSYENFSANSITQENLEEKLQQLISLTKRLQPILDQLDTMLQFTDPSTTLPEAQLNGFVSLIDGLRAQVQGQITAITQQVNSMQSFLATYQEQEASLRKQVDITKQQIAATKSSFSDSEISSNLWVQQAEKTYQSAVRGKDATLKSLASSIEQARVWLSEAQNQLAKFTVSSPIWWSIWEVLVDEWQEVNIWSPLFTVSSTNEQEITIALSEEDLKKVKVGQTVFIKINSDEVKGIISSISRTANANFTFDATVTLKTSTQLFGDLVVVEIPTSSALPVIPINTVTILWKNKGLITVWNGRSIESKQIDLWKVRWSNIEIVTTLPQSTKIITSNIANYNESKHQLIEK